LTRLATLPYKKEFIPIVGFGTSHKRVQSSAWANGERLLIRQLNETFEKWSVLPKFPDIRSGTGKAGENVSAGASLRVTAEIRGVF
jgi:hypothetical protein